MANVKITDLAAYTNPDSTDVLPIVDVGADVTKKISIADLLKNAGSGTESAPGIAFDGDSNTGIYRPGPDQVAISTNGTGRLFVDASGNVGIGTQTPGYALDVSTGSNGALNVSDSITGTVRIGSTYATTGRTFSIQSLGASSALRIYDEAAAAERARIDSSGRLLVGTSSAFTGFNGGAITPALQFAGGSNNTSFAGFIRTDDTAASSALVFAKGRSTSYAIVQENDELGRLEFQGADGTDFANGARIAAFVDGTPGADDMPGRLVFSTTADGASSPTERMRITNYGGTLLNTISATIDSANFGTAIGCNAVPALVPGLIRTSRDSGGIAPVFEAYGNAGQFRTLGDGDAENTNNSYAGISDIKLKENIVDAGSQWDDLKALQVRKYNFKAETGYNTHTQIGLVAQEVELVSPGLVGESIDEETGESTKSVNYSVLYMKAVKALQEAMDRIETLEAKVAAFEAS